jgi:hypothetical protein
MQVTQVTIFCEFLLFNAQSTNLRIGSLPSVRFYNADGLQRGMTRYKLRFTTVNCGIKPLDEHRYTFSDPRLVSSLHSHPHLPELHRPLCT